MSRRVSEVTCDALDDFGKGIVRIDKTTCFLDNLLPGEKAVVQTDFRYGKLAEAKVLERKSDSPFRVHPECKYYPNCGGCQLMHLSYPEQLVYKTKKVKDLLHKFAGIDFDVSLCLGLENPTRFRNKVQKPVRFDNKKKKIKAGFYQSGTHNLIGVDDCLMESLLSSHITQVLLSLFEKYHYTPYHENARFGLIRHLLIKTNTDQSQALVTLIVTRSDIKGIKEFAKELMKKVPQVVGLVLNINTRKTNVVLGEKDIPVYGHTKIQDKIFNKKFLISTQSFYQVNSHQIETLYGKAIEFADLSKEDTLLDAYCGTGTIGLCCADKVREVTGVEIVKDAVKDAVLNARNNHIENAKFLAMDATKYILTTDQKFSVVIMDPPRKGSTPEFISAVKKMAPKKVVYVSCDPVTLARDLALFSDSYEVKKVQPVDMFPNSMHVETVTLLSQREVKDKAVVIIDNLKPTKAEMKPTYDDIRKYVFDKYGVKVSSLNIAKAKSEFGVKERENYNLPKCDNPKRPNLTPERKKMIKEALEHFKMI